MDIKEDHHHIHQQKKIKKKFNSLVSDVPKPDLYDSYVRDKDAFLKYHIDTTYHHGDEEEKKRTMETLDKQNEYIRSIQFKRWEWARGHEWDYYTTLRLRGFSDDNIQAMASGLRPLCFDGPDEHAEWCKSLGELGKDLETQFGWKNVRFVHTGSSVVGFSTNPMKGVADRPTKITTRDGSDVDLVIVGEGVKEFVEKKEHELGKKIGHSFPSTRQKHGEFGLRIGCRHPEDISDKLKNWYDIWAAKFEKKGGLQITFDTDPNPSIPPWESWIHTH